MNSSSLRHTPLRELCDKYRLIKIHIQAIWTKLRELFEPAVDLMYICSRVCLNCSGVVWPGGLGVNTCQGEKQVNELFYARNHLQHTSTHEICIPLDHFSTGVPRRWDISHLGTGVSWRWDICHFVTGVSSAKHQSSWHGCFKEKGG